MKRSGWVFGVVSIIGVVGIAATTLWARPLAPTHVVLVIVCTMRKDQLTPYGGAKRATPGLARLAESGSLFESAFDAAPWTKAASTALWTGKHAITIGMTEPGEMRSLRVLPPEETTLAEHLHNAGYFTAGVTGNPNTSATFGFDQGFDAYYAGKTWNQGGGHPSGRQTFSVLLEELDKRPEGKPVFLQAMLLDPHEPVNVSANEIQSFKERGLPREVSKYRAALRQSDDAISEFWKALDARGFTPENTLRIVVNDHGEGLNWPGHHGRGHGNMTYQSSVSMPWILNGPGVAQDHRIQGIASQVDLVPTVLGLLGLSGYEGPGHNWQSQVRGAPRTDRDWAIVDTWFRKSAKTAIYTESTYCELDASEASQQPQVTCFDRLADPNAMYPTDHNDAALVQQLTDWRADAIDVFASYPHTRDTILSTPEESMLEALGYTEGGDGAPQPEPRR